MRYSRSPINRTRNRSVLGKSLTRFPKNPRDRSPGPGAYTYDKPSKRVTHSRISRLGRTDTKKDYDLGPG